MNKTTISSGNRFDLKELVRIIGYKLTAYIGHASISDVRYWFKHGLPRHLEERMRAAFDVAKPIEDAEFELIAQYFLMQKIAGIEPSLSISCDDAARCGRHNDCSRRAHGNCQEGIPLKRC